MNAFNPGLFSSNERLSEIAEILAAGLMRLRTRQSSPLSPDVRASFLDCVADQSGHADVLMPHGGDE